MPEPVLSVDFFLSKYLICGNTPYQIGTACFLLFRRLQITADAVQCLTVVDHPGPAHILIDAGSGNHFAMLDLSDHLGILMLRAGQSSQIHGNLGGNLLIDRLKRNNFPSETKLLLFYHVPSGYIC